MSERLKKMAPENPNLLLELKKLKNNLVIQGIKYNTIDELSNSLASLREDLILKGNGAALERSYINKTIDILTDMKKQNKPVNELGKSLQQTDYSRAGKLSWAAALIGGIGLSLGLAPGLKAEDYSSGSLASDLIVKPVFPDKTNVFDVTSDVGDVRLRDPDTGRIYTPEIENKRLVFSDIPTKVQEYNPEAQEFKLYQSNPNPSDGNLNVNFSADSPGYVYFTLANTAGQIALEDMVQVPKPGTYSVSANLGGLSSGVYFLRATDGDDSDAGKILLIGTSGSVVDISDTVKKLSSEDQEYAKKRLGVMSSQGMGKLYDLEITNSGKIKPDTIQVYNNPEMPEKEVEFLEKIIQNVPPPVNVQEGDTVRFNLENRLKPATGKGTYSVKSVSDNAQAIVENGVLLVYGKDQLSNGPWTASYKVTAPHGTQKGSAALGNFLPVADVYGTFRDIVQLSPEPGLGVLFDSTRTVTDAEGRFYIQLEPGRYEMNIDTTGKDMLNTKYEGRYGGLKVDGTDDINLDKILTDTGFLPVLYKNSAMPGFIDAMSALCGDHHTVAENLKWKHDLQDYENAVNGTGIKTLKTLYVNLSELDDTRLETLKRNIALVPTATRGVMQLEPIKTAVKLDTVFESKYEEEVFFDKFIQNPSDKYKNLQYIVILGQHTTLDINESNGNYSTSNGYATRGGTILNPGNMYSVNDLPLSEFISSLQCIEDLREYEEQVQGSYYGAPLQFPGLDNAYSFKVDYRGEQTAIETIVGSKCFIPVNAEIRNTPGGRGTEILIK